VSRLMSEPKMNCKTVGSGCAKVGERAASKIPRRLAFETEAE
jgi:hypothetical protein